MEPEFLLRLLAVLVGASLLIFTLVDFNWVLDKLLSRESNVVVPKRKENDKLFLHIVDLWYKLKESCESYELHNASEKLDEVFPLLNDKLEKDQL